MRRGLRLRTACSTPASQPTEVEEDRGTGVGGGVREMVWVGGRPVRTLQTPSLASSVRDPSVSEGDDRRPGRTLTGLVTVRHPLMA